MKNNKLKAIIGSLLVGGLLLTGCDMDGSVQDKVDILIPDIKNGESVDYIYALSKEKFSSYNFVISDK